MPEIQSAGRPKPFYDILLCDSEWTRYAVVDMDSIDLLRAYLADESIFVCGLRWLVFDTNAATRQLLLQLNIPFDVVTPREAVEETARAIGCRELASAAETALACDADVLVTTNKTWFPYVDELDRLGLFISDTSFVKRAVEVFVRGHGVPWSFAIVLVAATYCHIRFPRQPSQNPYRNRGDGQENSFQSFIASYPATRITFG